MKSTGFVQVSDATGTPLVWAGSDTYMAGTWLSLAAGQPVCDFRHGTCYITRHVVAATVNGSVATLQPFGAAHLGGYSLAIGENDTRSSIISGSQSACAFDGPPQFAAAALREP